MRNDEEIIFALRKLGGRAVVETPHDGYDGKGVAEVRLAPGGRCETSAPVGQRLGAAGGEGLLTEEFVPSTCEVSQLVIRRPGGGIVSWCAVETIQRGGACAGTIASARVSSDVAGCVADVAKATAEEPGVVGMLAVEIFAGDAGRILVNELAACPHNSGHWTIEGTVANQFEQRLRAILDLPLGPTDLLAPQAVMVNLLGPEFEDPRDAYPGAMALHPSAKIHVYGKEVRPGCKLGRVTVRGDDLGTARTQARETVEALAGRGVPAGSPTVRG